MLTNKEQMLLSALEPKAQECDIEIVTVEIVGAKRAPTIRVFIDTIDENTGVSFDVLSSAQEWIGAIVDDIDPFPGAYMLEVSSPGIDRPLRTPEHFMRFAGSKARIRTTVPIDGRQNFSGTLGGMDGSEVLIDIDGATFRIPYDQVKRANVVGQIDFNRPAAALDEAAAPDVE